MKPYVFGGETYVAGETKCTHCGTMFSFTYLPGRPPVSLAFCFDCDPCTPIFEPTIFMMTPEHGLVSAMVQRFEESRMFGRYV